MKELPEIIFASSDPTQSRKIKDWIKRGKIRRLIARVYTSNLVDAPDMIIKRNIWSILSQLFPGTIISHRTALELKISPANCLYLTGNSRRVYRWPGVNLRFTDGPPPLDHDSKAFMNLYVSSFERACLENLSSARLVEHERRVVHQEIVEDRLADLLNTRGESALNQVRDTAREIANSFGWIAEFEKLSGIISSLLTSRLTTNLKSSHAISTAIGEPYDASRIELFSELIAELNSTPFADRKEKTETLTDFTNFAFFEAYFSNYIEGTTFLVEEAIDIIFNKVTIQLRLEDSHDIRGTYDIASNRDEMEIQPSNSDEFIDLLKGRHSRILFGRPEQNPGIFKTRQNRAGESFL
ncbi:MAG: cell filamentation protein Fic [Saprospiraceae bacterium]|nr:cell filamentation protein Fic [Saprospiraceae bacterium]